jgi:YVTN family beta-propeller protein
MEGLRMNRNSISKRSLLKTKRLAVPWLLLAIPLAAGSTRIYVANTAGTSVSVIDPAKNKVVQEIKDIQVPESVAVSPDGKRVYISQWTNKVLTVVDRKSGKKIKDVPVTGHSHDVAATKDGKWVLVCNAQNPGGLDIVDAHTLELVKSVPAKIKQHDVVVTNDSKYAITTAEGQPVMTVIDLQTQTVAWEHHFDMGTQVAAIESNPDGSARRVFVQLNRLRGFAVVDFATHEETARITLPDDQPSIKTSMSGHGIAVSPDGKWLWNASKTYDAVFVYALPEIKLVGRVPMPKLMPPGHDPLSGSPNWITFTPDSKKAYVINAMDRSVSVVDVKTLTVTGRIPVGEEPSRMTLFAGR